MTIQLHRVHDSMWEQSVRTPLVALAATWQHAVQRGARVSANDAHAPRPGHASHTSHAAHAVPSLRIGSVLVDDRTPTPHDGDSPTHEPTTHGRSYGVLAYNVMGIFKVMGAKYRSTALAAHEELLGLRMRLDEASDDASRLEGATGERCDCSAARTSGSLGGTRANGAFYRFWVGRLIDDEPRTAASDALGDDRSASGSSTGVPKWKQSAQERDRFRVRKSRYVDGCIDDGSCVLCTVSATVLIALVLRRLLLESDAHQDLTLLDTRVFDTLVSTMRAVRLDMQQWLSRPDMLERTGHVPPGAPSSDRGHRSSQREWMRTECDRLEAIVTAVEAACHPSSARMAGMRTEAACAIAVRAIACDAHEGCLDALAERVMSRLDTRRLKRALECDVGGIATAWASLGVEPRLMQHSSCRPKRSCLGTEAPSSPTASVAWPSASSIAGSTYSDSSSSSALSSVASLADLGRDTDLHGLGSHAPPSWSLDAATHPTPTVDCVPLSDGALSIVSRLQEQLTRDMWLRTAPYGTAAHASAHGSTSRSCSTVPASP